MRFQAPYNPLPLFITSLIFYTSYFLQKQINRGFNRLFFNDNLSGCQIFYLEKLEYVKTNIKIYAALYQLKLSFSTPILLILKKKATLGQVKLFLPVILTNLISHCYFERSEKSLNFLHIYKKIPYKIKKALLKSARL